MQLSRDVNVLIIEDDHYYNDLLAKRIRSLKNKPDINGRYRLKIQQIFEPEQFLDKKDNGMEQSGRTIAFVDFYLGSGRNGLQVSGKLADMNEDIKIVLMSHSEEVIRELEQSGSDANLYTNLVKHEYTPEICSIIVENYINNL